MEAVVHCSEDVVDHKQRYPDHGFGFALAEVSLGSMTVAGTRMIASIGVGKARPGIASIEAYCP